VRQRGFGRVSPVRMRTPACALAPTEKAPTEKALIEKALIERKRYTATQTSRV
jgi:hypothetical protein